MAERAYLHRSSHFNTIPYRLEEYIKAMREAGVPLVRTSRLNGWRNQPKIVTFPASHEATVEAALRKLPEFAKWGPIIHRKGW